MPIKLSCWSIGPLAPAGAVVWLVSGSRGGRAVQWWHHSSSANSGWIGNWRS
jgi:hypothetical protein